MTNPLILDPPAVNPSGRSPSLCFSLFSITGADAQDFLHRLLSNEIRNLAEGEGVATCLLSKDGRIQLYFWLFRFGEGYLALVAGDQRERFIPEIDRYLFSERVRIEEVPAEAPVSVVWGDASLVFLEWTRSGGTVSETGLMVGEMTSGGSRGWVFTMDWHSRPVFVYWPKAVPPDGKSRVAPGLPSELEFHQLRVQHGTPWPGFEIDSSMIPVECGLEASVSLTKGCYVGQEVIARMANLGKPPRLLRGFILEGKQPAQIGARIRVGEAEVGRVLSSVKSYHGAVPVGLTSIRRKFAEPGTAVDIEGVEARILDLPFEPSL